MRRSAGWPVAGLAAACLMAATAGALLVGRGLGPSATPTASQHTVTEEQVVVLGDSVATGSGCDCTPFGPRLATVLTDRLHRPVHVSTLAKDGLTTAGLMAQLRSDTTTIADLGRAAAVTVTIGANDFDESQADGSCPSRSRGSACYEDGVKALRPRLTALLLTLRAMVPQRAQIVLTGYWNVFRDGDVGASEGPTYQRVSDDLTQRVNDTVRACAGTIGASYADLYGAFHGDGTVDDTHLLADDGDHPNNAGQQRIAQVVADSLRRDDAS